MLRRIKGDKRVSPVKQRRALQSNIPPERPVKEPKVEEAPALILDFSSYKSGNSHRNRFIKQFINDGFIICGICKKKIEDIRHITVDHIIPKSKGGSNRAHNVQPAHPKCNNEKGDSIPEGVTEVPKVRTVKLRDFIPKEIIDIFGEVEEAKDNVVDFLYPE